MTDDRPNWLAVHQERPQEAHSRAQECAERKAAERVALQKEREYCPPIDVGQLVYLCHWPLGRNKIQDAWAAMLNEDVDVQFTKYAVESLEGRSVKRVHRSYLQPCVGPTSKQRCHAASPIGESTSSLVSENEVGGGTKAPSSQACGKSGT